jgi:hypothetical protein
MLAVDIASYSRRRPDIQLHLRKVLYQIVPDACEASGMPWDSCYREDRGDSILVLPPADTDADALVNTLVIRLHTELRKHNKTAAASAQIQLRQAIHAGWVSRDDQGISGHAVNHLFRMLEAPAFKSELAAHGGALGVIISAGLYREAVQYTAGPVAPDALRRINVDVKETKEPGWIWLSPDGGPTGRQTAPPIAAYRPAVVYYASNFPVNYRGTNGTKPAT